MDSTRRGWLKALMALPAVVVGSKLLPAEEVKPAVKVEPKEELPMVRKGIMSSAMNQDETRMMSYTVTGSYKLTHGRGRYYWEEQK